MNEWDNEPDELKWKHCGFECAIMRSHMKHLCGYVGLPKWHPYYSKTYNDIDVDVHGGLTYASEGDGEYLPKGLWWIGFDCAHARDLSPGLFQRFGGLMPDNLMRPGEVYRNIKYVKRETERLAEQLTVTAIAERVFENG